MPNSAFRSPGLVLAIISSVSLFALILYRGYRARRFYRDLPGPPHSWLWGHISIFRDITRLMPPNSMPQLHYTEIAHRYNLHGIFYLDLWPIGPGLVIITDPKLIEQAAVPRPLVPHPMTNTFMASMVGENSIPTKGGTEWRKLHNLMSPAFSNAYARGLVGVMVDASRILRSKLDEFSATGQVFSMEDMMIKLVFRIVSRQILNAGSYAQEQGRQDLANMRELVDLAQEESDPRIAYNLLVQIPRRLRRYFVRRKLETSILGFVYKRLKVLVRKEIVPSRQNPTSILDLMLREHVESAIKEKKKGRNGVLKLSGVEEKQLLSYLRILLLGGHTTSTNTLTYLFMLLSQEPQIVDKMRQEHAQQLGSDPQTTILDNPDMLFKLTYTEAVIKEVLRLYPVGSSLRLGPPGATVCHQGRHLPIDNSLVVMTNAHGIHYDPSLYSRHTTFQPERWLGQNKTHPGPRYFRPFGGDGRWCPGQNIAMYILRVVLVMIIGDYTFECADIKPNLMARTLHTDIDMAFGDIAFQELGLEGKPRDGMMMTVRKRA
ncbi:hypothetical protein FPOAC1_011653 [Fusarium poae]|uniref:hypothetical protein n=1 Tax=Fusarium poae TaxID=36050 RepID=UPI001CE88AA0|nr:hypothetical protein FPOAC1_011653 [Fusarium poae]KAG8666832.1 hypothetical protein FPOAC1_011653 [Fusarium poae]